jgi:hypothetical protein
MRLVPGDNCTSSWVVLSLERALLGDPKELRRPGYPHRSNGRSPMILTSNLRFCELLFKIATSRGLRSRSPVLHKSVS